MKLIHDKNGRTLLHIWRTGTSFELTDRFQLYKYWNNVKFSSLPYANDNPYIRYLELRKPLPFKDNQFDVIYCNHVLEHLIPKDGEKLCRELYRLLKPNGICRIVVPDLETTAIEYLSYLNNVQKDNSKINNIRYEWATAHLIDQMVRLKPGGKMAEKLRSNQVDWEQIKLQNGDVFNRIKENNQKKIDTKKYSTKKRFRNIYNKYGLKRMLHRFWFYILRNIKIKLSKKSLVELYNEKNLWMYDRQSLFKLVKSSNFENIELMDFKTSGIKDWEIYNFDQSEKGNYPLEPSIYIECAKSNT